MLHHQTTFLQIERGKISGNDSININLTRKNGT